MEFTAKEGPIRNKNPKKPRSGDTTRCGFIALVGPTNAGKSTFVNTITEQKISIVSHKVQTTRTRVLGILEHNDTQIIFIDTPGLFTPKKRLDRAMIQAAEMGMAQADVVLLILDTSKPEEVVLDDAIKSFETLQKAAPNKPVYLGLNKIDKIKKERLLSLTQKITSTTHFDAVFMFSALNKKDMPKILNQCEKDLPKMPWRYPEGEGSTLPFRLMAAEVTREKVMDLVHQEIPYALTVITEHVEAFDNGDFKLLQTIFVEKNSQKTILVGKGGSKIKQIGQSSRLDLEKIFENRIHLNLFVKVKANWQQDPAYYTLWGLEDIT